MGDDQKQKLQRKIVSGADYIESLRGRGLEV